MEKPSNNPLHGGSTGVVAGVIGAVVFVIILIVIAVYLRRKKIRKDRNAAAARARSKLAGESSNALIVRGEFSGAIAGQFECYLVIPHKKLRLS